MKQLITQTLSISALIGVVFGAIAYMDEQHVGKESYAADKMIIAAADDNDFRRDLEQDVNTLQIQKSILFGQRRSAPVAEQEEIDDELEVLNDQLKQTKQRLRELSE